MKRLGSIFISSALVCGLGTITPAYSALLNLSDAPLFTTTAVPPLTLMVLGRDHKLYYEAYNDASDLDGDGIIDIGYKPEDIDYYGYFGSNVCYIYSSGNGRFEPSSNTANKKCTGGSEWSGDFLNYLTTSRMDALRKVFYGGKRSADTDSLTVLERAYIPQDGHSWGKEYTSVAIDGYDISEYSPLSLPATNTRHLFANTTLSDGGAPLLRVLNDSQYRIWNWVSIERPVAGNACNNSSGTRVTCANGGWVQVPASAFPSGLTRTTWSRGGGSAVIWSNPNNQSEMNTLMDYFISQPSHTDGTGAVTTIGGTDNPFGQDDYFLTMVGGTLRVDTTGTYTFGVDGDDAVDVFIKQSTTVGMDISPSTDTPIASWYGGHGSNTAALDSHSGTITLTAGIDYDILFRHEEATGGSSYGLYWSTASSAITDYTVRAKVCVDGLLEANCQAYPDGNYKPVGLLQEYGENDSMYFGLLSGSYEKNTSGGVLRKNIGTITNEINNDDGTFTAANGIIATMNKLRIVGFDYGSYSYNQNCGWITTRPINQGECRMWGNPVGEMMYEGMRYFAGKSGPTSAYSIANSGNDDATLGLPLPNWTNPYSTFSQCSKPFQIVISDINPSFDTDQIPGSYFNSFSGDLSGLNAQTLADSITTLEGGIAGTSRFIGQSGSTYDGAPTAKTVSSLGNIRGLSPEEPTKQGGYYSASVAHYGKTTDLNSADGDQKVDTFSVAMASPLPRIEIPVDGKTITLVPFAKSVWSPGSNPCVDSISPNSSCFQPTNTIVDFYVETLTSTYGKFRINYEDVEQGADHDMDAIVEYEYTVNGDNTVTIELNSTYAAGGIIQHMGYVISGTTADGIYLEVRDEDTASGSDVDYYLDTPNTASVALPLTASRTFTPGVSAAATLLKDPLWYAAKWGGFQENAATANDQPDLDSEWDEDGDGTPDNYFLVTNALKLSEQLSAAFDEILSRSGVSSSAAALTSGEISANTTLIQSTFNTGDWTGDITAYSIISDPADGPVGSIDDTPVWSAAANMPEPDDRVILTHDGTGGVAFQWSNLSAAQQSLLNGGGLGSQRVDYLRGEEISGFRVRPTIGAKTHILGDMVNSSPVYVGIPKGFYPDSLESVAYSTYYGTDRTPVVYVGSNDGMLHGFDASLGVTKGTELVAYVPNEVYSNLSLLTSPSYSHRYYVDGEPAVADAFWGSAWHTVLAGGLNGGGQAIYALDVTDPDDFSEANASSIVLWEFSDSDDADLGYTYSKPAIVKLKSGEWAAIFGNGYNNTAADGAASSSGHAVLYIVNIQTGALIKKISTLAGSVGTPNGLTSVAAVDKNSDFIVDYVYAGDLLGNMWKFDLTGATAASWDVAYLSGTTPIPLFVAENDSGDKQAITSQVEVGFAPNYSDLMVYFGTGKYLESSDNSDLGTVQSLYGVIDAGAPILDGRTSFLEQTIDGIIEAECTDIEGNTTDCNYRVTSDNAMTSANKGWFMDLTTPAGDPEGERVIYSPVLIGDRISFVTLIPSGDICNPDGTGWLMKLDARDGSRLDGSPFDRNNDGFFDAKDLITDAEGDEVVSSGSQIKNGAAAGKSAILGGDGQDLSYTQTTTGIVEVNREDQGGMKTGRQSWRQIK